MSELALELAQIEAARLSEVNYQKSLALLRALKSGKVSLDEIAIVPGGWSLVPKMPEGVTVTHEPIAPANDLHIADVATD